MSTTHHGDNPEAHRLFMEQFMGTAKREYPHGRIGPDDDGALSYAMATDDKRRIIVIRFPKPTAWIGLDLASAVELNDQLTERIMALRGVAAKGLQP